MMNSSNVREKRPRESNTPDCNSEAKRHSNYHGSGRFSNYSNSNDCSRYSNQKPSSFNSVTHNSITNNDNSYNSNHNRSNRNINNSTQSPGAASPRRTGYHGSGTTYKEYNPNRSSRGIIPERERQAEGHNSSSRFSQHSPYNDSQNRMSRDNRDSRSTLVSKATPQCSATTPSSTTGYDSSSTHTPLVSQAPHSLSSSSSLKTMTHTTTTPRGNSRPPLPLSVQRSVTTDIKDEHIHSSQPQFNRSVSSPAAMGSSQTASSSRGTTVVSSQAHSSNSMNMSDLPVNILSDLEVYVKMMDFACFTSLYAFGLKCPVNGFGTLEVAFKAVEDKHRLAKEKEKEMERKKAERKKKEDIERKALQRTQQLQQQQQQQKYQSHNQQKPPQYHQPQQHQLQEPIHHPQGQSSHSFSSKNSVQINTPNSSSKCSTDHVHSSKKDRADNQHGHGNLTSEDSTPIQPSESTAPQRVRRRASRFSDFPPPPQTPGNQAGTLAAHPPLSSGGGRVVIRSSSSSSGSSSGSRVVGGDSKNYDQHGRR